MEETPFKGCPNDSKLGTVKAASPAVKEEASGSVFLGEPTFNSREELVLTLYLVMRIPDRGIIVKAEGKVTANVMTGQLVTVFDNIPPLPFNLLTFSFRQGETSPLVSPPGCGQYKVAAELTPSSAPSEILTPEIPPFLITSGFEGGACPGGGVPPFDPQLVLGTQNNNAGSFSPLDLRLTRGDGEQEITGFSLQLPSGLTANLVGVPFCTQADVAIAQAKTGALEEADPSCPAASEIGHTLVGAGVGSVLVYAPGKVYMAGPFEGSPFSIVAITSARVGPFDLGTVVVHLPLQIDPLTAAVSVAAGRADQIPHIVKGIVVHVREIRVNIDRPNFILNPTNCERMSLSATVIGSGASFVDSSDDDPVTVGGPFQAANCQDSEVQTEVHGVDVWEDLPREGRQSDSQAGLPGRGAGISGEYPVCEGGPSEAVAVATYDASEGLS